MLRLRCSVGGFDRPTRQAVRVTREQVVWIFRAVWFVLPLTAGAALSAALDQASSPVRLVALVIAWTLWAAVTLGSFAPHPLSLTGIRIVAPLTVGLAVWPFTAGGTLGVAALFAAHAVVASLLALHQLVGDYFADGASYGDERRMLLRPSAPIMVAGVPLAWMTIAALVPGVLLLAGQRWVSGIALTAIGAIGGPFAVRALHQLAKRWIVFVPTGFVLHDLAVLTEPVLFRRTAVERLGPAIAGTPARDLTNQAPGLQLECELADAAPLGLVTGRTGSAKLTDTRRFLFCPTRPGALLDEAERRGISVD